MTENIANNTSNKDIGLVQPLLPDFCNVRVLFAVILLTEVLAIVFAMAASTNRIEFWDYLALSSFLMMWIALLNSAVLCAMRKWLHQQKQSLCLVISFCLMMGVSLLVTLLVNNAGILFDYNDDTLDFLLILRVITISAVIYFLLLRYFYVQYQWRLNIALQSTAEIQALRARIRPHFLFNSMNTIASLIATSPETAETAIEDLSDLFRASLSEHNMNPLRDEIELAKSYLAIETLRLGKRLQIEWKIDEQMLDIEVPSLCLQPLTENAIYHGIEPMQKGGKILISALQIDKKLQLSVSNPLKSENQTANAKKGNQMAQENIRQRLKLVYGKKGSFTINDTKENYTVSLIIPLDVNHERFNSR